MKLNKIEKIVIAVLLTAGILTAGIIMFVLPAYQSIAKNNKELTSVQKELDDINTTLLRKDTIDKEIEDVRKEAEKLEGSFYPDLTTYEADEIVQAYMRANEMEVMSLAVSELSTTDIKVTAFSTTEVEYQLKTYSQAASALEETSAAEGEENAETTEINAEYDENGKIISINGTPIAKVEEELKKLFIRANLLTLTQQTQTTAYMEVEIDGTCKYGKYEEFIDYINDLERATYLPEVKFTFTTDEKPEDNPLASADKMNERIEVDEDTILEFTGLKVCMYCVQPMGIDEMETIDAAGEKIVINQ